LVEAVLVSGGGGDLRPCVASIYVAFGRVSYWTTARFDGGLVRSTSCPGIHRPKAILFAGIVNNVANTVKMMTR